MRTQTPLEDGLAQMAAWVQGHGARQYNEMVTAAAQLVSAANSGSMSSSPMSQQRYRDEVVNATDRMMGWAQAFDELGRLRGA